MSRDDVERILSRHGGVSLDHEWDGVSEEIPVLIPSSYNPWTSCRGTAKLSLVREVYEREQNPTHPCG